jgi:ATP-dependent protease ClpP protease subunit
MIGTIHITGEIGVDVTLLDVIKQVKNQPNATEFLVRLDSVGGYVQAGDDIYSYLKNLFRPITVFVIKAYSIASKILIAGDKRILNESDLEVVMIHLP